MLSFAEAVANANRGVFATTPQARASTASSAAAPPTSAREALTSLTSESAGIPVAPPRSQPAPFQDSLARTQSKGTVTINGVTYDIVDGVVIAGSARKADDFSIPGGEDPTVIGSPNLQVPGGETPSLVSDPVVPSSGGASESTPFNEDVFAQIKGLLSRYGLGGLTDWVRGLVVNEASAAEISIQLFDRQEFKDRFPGIAAIDADNQGGVTRPNISPEEYLNLEQDYFELLSRVGLDEAFFTRDRVANWIVEGVSPAEVSRRVTNGYSKITLASQETRDSFGQYFGAAGDTALAAFFLDAGNVEDVLMRQVETAEIGGRARIAGIGIGQAGAERFAALGITPQGASNGFSNINRRRDLFTETATEGRDLTRSGAGVSAQFGLDSGQAQGDLDKRLQTRQAAFRGGGGAFVGQRTTGFGKA